MEKIRRIIFDLDNTLIEWKDEYWNSVNKAFEELNLSYSNKEVENVKHAIDCYEDGRYKTYNIKNMHERIEEELGYKLPLKFTQTCLNNFAECVPEKMSTDIIEVLRYLKSKYDLVILSNWLKFGQVRRLEKTGLISFFSEIYTPEEFAMKPSKESFYIAKGDYKVDECVMIGDSLRVDVEGALNAGMKAIYLKPNAEKTQIDDKNFIKTITTLKELTNIL